MSNTTTTRYNLNEMRPVLLDRYNEGNRRLAKKEDVEALGLSGSYFDWYINSLCKLYDACLAVAEDQHDFTRNVDEKTHAEIKNKVCGVWKSVLESVEPEKDSHVIRCNPVDVDDLIGFVWKFAKDANNLTGDKDFVARKRYATDSMTNFRRKVETMLGNMAAATSQMDGYTVRFLKEESRLLSKVKKNKSKVADAEAELNRLESEKSKTNSADVAAYIADQIKSLKNNLKTLRKNRDDSVAALDAFHKNPDSVVDKVDRMAGAPRKEEQPAPAADAPADAQK